jgi:hypothetical protein
VDKLSTAVAETPKLIESEQKKVEHEHKGLENLKGEWQNSYLVQHERGAVMGATRTPKWMIWLKASIAGLLSGHVQSAMNVAAESSETSQNPAIREFIGLGLQIHEHEEIGICPFCRENTLTPEKLSALQQIADLVPEAKPSLVDAQNVLVRMENTLQKHSQFVARLVPVLPSSEQDQVISDLGADVPRLLEHFREVERSILAQAGAVRSARSVIEVSIRNTTQLLVKGSASADEFTEIMGAVEGYSKVVKALPAVANGFSATYAALDPYIKRRLASAQEVRFLALLDLALEKWKDVELASYVEGLGQLLQEIVRQTRQFIEKKQREILGARDKDIRTWYDLMNPGALVGYEGISPGTDSVELRARSFAKSIMAAPNLSASQLNCIGLAVYLACATRIASPHSMLLFDDPIQSMDDEHAEAFKKVIVKDLLDRGFQVILLTHMDNFADEVEKLYRGKYKPSLFKLQAYSQSGPVVVSSGPEIQGLLAEIRRNKDSLNEGFRKQAVQALRQFVERFVKDLYIAEAGGSLSKRFENKNWSELKPLLRQCKKFDSNDEALLEDTHNFTCQFLHTDGTIPAKIASSAQIQPHFTEMDTLFKKYKDVFKIK